MADRLHVKPRHRAAIGRLLREHLPGVEAWAYGSRASGRSHDGSDLDLALRGPGLREIPAARLAAFDDALRESNVPFLVEARDWARIPERFRREIERNHVVLAEKPRAASNAWRTTTVGEFCPFSYGRSLPGSLRDGTGHQVYGSNGPVGRHSRPLVESGVIVGRKGTVGSVHYSPAPFWPIDTAFYVAPGPERDIRFTYYLLCSLGLSRMNSDSAVPGLNRGNAHAIELRVPSLREQRAIARVLGALDDKIELNRRMNETLEATARAIFNDWFVDFGPVRAKMDGRQPYLPPEIWELFPMTLDDTGMPSGWKRDRLGAIATAHAYGAAPGNVPTDTPYIGLKHIPRRSVAIESWDNAHNVSTAKFKFRKGDFLFGRLRPYFHKVGIAPVDGICSTDIVVVVPKRPEWRSVTLFVISSRNFVDYADRTSTGTKMPRTGWNTMCQFPICLPAENLAGAFDDHVNGLLRRVQSNVRTTQALAQIRNALLPRLVSGEVRMPKETPNLQQIEV